MEFDLDFTFQATEEIEFHKKVGDKAVLKKLLKLLEEISEHPFEVTGKPEPLKYSLNGCWSRRINREHRLVYEVKESRVNILSVKGHYS
jgi:toxin YoeB